MKKILSTFVMCLILGVGALYSQGSVTVYAYANVNTQSQSNLGGGEVQAHAASRDRWAGSSWKSGARGSSSSIVGQEAIGRLSGTQYKVSYSADAYPNNGYYFSHWLNENGVTLTGKGDTKNGIKDIEHSWVGSGNKNVLVFAIFKPVEISNAPAATIATTDLNGTNTVKVVFPVTHADNNNDFQTPIISGEGFAIDSWSYADNTVTVVVRFTDFNKDNVNGDFKPTFTGTVTLKSAGGENSGTTTITATSDLAPKTTITPSPCDLTPSSPVLAGNTVSATLNVAAAAGYTNVFKEATITAVEFTNPEDAELKGYTLELDATNPEAPKVSFTPTEFSINQANVETEIRVTTAYTDANGKEITHTECDTITADAGKIITIGGVKNAVMDFGIIDYTATTVQKSIEYPIYSTLAAAAFTKTDSRFTTDISYVVNEFEGSATDGKLTVTVNSTMVPNDYTATLTYTENGADPISATLTVKVSIKLAKPVVTTTVLDGNVTLSWPAVYGASSYIIKTDGVVIETTTATTYKVIEIGGQKLTKGRQYPFTVTAVYKDNSIGNRESDIVYATPGIPTEITYGTIDDINMYTGTEKGAGDGGVYESFPYSKQRPISLDNVFDEITNAPLFDFLYIFGITTNQDGGNTINNTLESLTTPCNAKTPCYVYRQLDGKYVFDSEFDAVTTRFDHQKNMGNKKLYFTGYCPFANIGRTVDDEGWMYFEGNQSSPVDIYLEDCQIYGRFRSSDGSQDTGKYPYNEVLIAADIGKVLGGEENINHMKGFSSIFVFHSTATNSGTPYKPTIHIRGNNHLKGQLGYINEVFAYVLGSKISMEQITGTPLRGIGTSSAPITIKSSSTNGYTHLTLDDFWPTSSTTREPTNGYLKLDTYTLGEASRVPSIDMGSEFSSITFNGGQYNLHNSAAPDGEYTCNMAISHRKFYKSAEVFSMEVKVSLYGFGGDKTTNQVIINSGTFTMEKNMYGDLGGSYYIDQDKFLDLRLPAGVGEIATKSQINGGTFNGISNVVFCSEVASSGGSPINAEEEWLCLQDIEIPVEKAPTAYGSATFDIPEPFDLYEDPLVVYNLNGNLESVSTADLYGGQSVNAYTKNGQRVVSLLLSGGGAGCESGGCTNCEKIEEALYRNWATTIPLFDVKMAGVDTKVGGKAEVPYKKEGGGESALDVKVSQLLYMDLEGLQNTKVELGDTEAQIANPDMARGNFTNEQPYKILKHLNLLKAVQADRWYTFVAPFNIHKVEVLELDEDKIKEKKTRTEAMQAQIHATAKFLMDNNGLFLPNTEGRSAGMTLEEIVILSPEIQKKELIPLYHYNGLKVADKNYGKNILEANYYLYEVPDANFDKETTLSGQDTFKIAWKPVSRPEGKPLMYKGKVYAMQFPFCPMCENVTVNDYWSNKLIRFYGAGGKTGQTVNGTAYQETILSTSSTMPGAIFTGNATLSDMTLADPIAYVHNTTNDYFELNPASYVVKPTEGFLLYTPEAGAQMPTRISRTGQIEYDENAETGIDGVPTVGDRTSLMLFGAYDGFEVLALHEQLVTVYNLQGNIIFQQYMTAGEQVYVATGAGIYVVRGESEAIKVMVD